MKTILIIEDNAEVLANTAEILQLSGYCVLTSANGKEGVEMARAQHPDLILCDVMMPELDGYGVLHLLNRHPATAYIPFVFLTAKAEKSDIQKAMSLGADGYLIKPFDDVSLLEMVDMRLQKVELLKEEFKRNGEGFDDFLQKAKGVGELHQLLNEGRRIMHVKRKHLIYMEGDYPGAVYFVHKGKVKTFKTNREGRELIMEVFKEGDFFGYEEIIENCNYHESAAALETSELYVIQRQDFNDLLYRNRDVSDKFIKILAGELMDREERLLQLAYNSVRKRVADSLVLLHERYQETEMPSEFNVTREDLSNLVGASKETVIRTLSDFRQEHLIYINDQGTIQLVNLERLRNLRN
jgi:CheY-like chemotaxis protein